MFIWPIKGCGVGPVNALQSLFALGNDLKEKNNVSSMMHCKQKWGEAAAVTGKEPEAMQSSVARGRKKQSINNIVKLSEHTHTV